VEQELVRWEVELVEAGGGVDDSLRALFQSEFELEMCELEHDDGADRIARAGLCLWVE